MPLNEVFWLRVRELLRAQGRDESFLREMVPRDKNTYTKWFRRLELKKIKDLEDIASALGVNPSTLLADESLPLTAFKLELPLQQNRRTSLEIEYAGDRLVLTEAAKS
jgi:hypothetical protein